MPEVCSIDEIGDMVLIATLKTQFEGPLALEDDVEIRRGKNGRPTFSRRGILLYADDVCGSCQLLGEKLVMSRLPIEKLRVHRHAVYCDLTEAATKRRDLLLAFQRVLSEAWRLHQPRPLRGHSVLLEQRSAWGVR